MKLKPIINDEAIDEILNGSGLKKEESNDLKKILSESGLSLENTIQNLANLALNGDDAIRIRATEGALKLHKVLEPEQLAQPFINITIQSGAAPDTRSIHGIASILVPRTLEMKSQILIEQGS